MVVWVLGCIHKQSSRVLLFLTPFYFEKDASIGNNKPRRITNTIEKNVMIIGISFNINLLEFLTKFVLCNMPVITAICIRAETAMLYL